jgi:hypothetical protein
MEFKSLPEYPDRPQPSRPPSAAAVAYGRRDRLIASLIRLGCIAFILVALTWLRSAALSAERANRPRTPSELEPLFGEWQRSREGRAAFCLSFSKDGKYREFTWDGKLSRSGSFVVKGDDILVTNIVDRDGKPETSWLDHSKARLEALALKIVQEKDRLVVESSGAKWVYIESGETVDPFYYHPELLRATYKRRPVPPADAANAPPREVVP